MGVNFARKSCQMPSHASVVSDKYWAGGYMSERAYPGTSQFFSQESSVDSHSTLSDVP
jgi:hypothetical protein